MFGQWGIAGIRRAEDQRRAELARQVEALTQAIAEVMLAEDCSAEDAFTKVTGNKVPSKAVA